MWLVVLGMSVPISHSLAHAHFTLVVKLRNVHCTRGTPAVVDKTFWSICQIISKAIYSVHILFYVHPLFFNVVVTTVEASVIMLD